jgi:hypothetical protein
MNLADFDHLASALSALATIIALVVGGAWTYQRFVRTREANPKIEFEVNVEFVVRQQGLWIAEALAFLENKGLVRHDITEFSFSIRYLLAGDPIEASKGFLAYVPHDGGSGSWLPPDWGNTFIEPGLRTRYSALIRVPAEASAVLIHGKFFYPDGDWHTSDRLVAVPRFADKRAEGAAADPGNQSVVPAG